MSDCVTPFDSPLAKELALQPAQRPGVRSVVNVLVVLRGITRPAQGLDVVNIAVTTFADGLNMVCREFDSSHFTAKALVAVVVTERLELGGRVRTACLSFAGSAAVHEGTGHFWVVFCPSAVTFRVPIGVILSVSAGLFCHLVWVGLLPTASGIGGLIGIVSTPAAGLGTLALLALPVVAPIVCAALLARFSVGFSHKKSPFALVAKEALGYTPFATSAYYTCRHALETLARLPGFFRSLTPVIIPNCRTIYQGANCD